MKIDSEPCSRVTGEMLFNGTLARDAPQAVPAYRFLPDTPTNAALARKQARYVIDSARLSV
jgi:hypothetical protein